MNVSTRCKATSAHEGTLLYMVLSWMLVGVWAGFIVLMSSKTGETLSSGNSVVSQLFLLINESVSQLFGYEYEVASVLGHFCEYAVLGALLVNALHWHISLQYACVFAVVIASMYGVSDEFHQWFVPGRTSDPVDWLVDTGAAALGVIGVGWRIRAVARQHACHTR